MHLTIQANEKNVVIYTLLSLGRQIEMRETRSVVEHRTIDSPKPTEFVTMRREILVKTNGHPARLVRQNEKVAALCRAFIGTVADDPHRDALNQFNEMFMSLNHYAI